MKKISLPLVLVALCGVFGCIPTSINRHLLRTHSFLKVTRIEPALQIASLDLKWLRDFLGKHPKAIRHHRIGEGAEAQIVLTASTPELRKFVEKHLKTEGAFGEPVHLKRKQSETKSQK